jgi:hypothetical protein
MFHPLHWHRINGCGFPHSFSDLPASPCLNFVFNQLGGVYCQGSIHRFAGIIGCTFCIAFEGWQFPTPLWCLCQLNGWANMPNVNFVDVGCYWIVPNSQFSTLISKFLSPLQEILDFCPLV